MPTPIPKLEEIKQMIFQSGLKKTSLIRANKIATVSKSVFQRKLGKLSTNLLPKVQKDLKIALNLA